MSFLWSSGSVDERRARVRSKESKFEEYDPLLRQLQYLATESQQECQMTKLDAGNVDSASHRCKSLLYSQSLTLGMIVDPELTKEANECIVSNQTGGVCGEKIKQWSSKVERSFDGLLKMSDKDMLREAEELQRKCTPRFRALEACVQTHGDSPNLEQLCGAADVEATDCALEVRCPKPFAAWKKCAARKGATENVMALDLESFSGECLSEALDVRECVIDGEGLPLKVLGVKPFAK